MIVMNLHPVPALSTFPLGAVPPWPTGSELAWSIVAAAAVLAGMVALLVWLGRRRARGAFRARLKDYKGKAVAMMDRLDALKARLKALPIEDGDFAEPMTGETLALYERTQGDLRALWDRWLEVMDVVDRAERHGEKGAKGVRAGDELVSDAKVFEEVEAAAVACSALMDRLNAAHEDARAAARAAEEARARATKGVEEVGAAGLPTAPYRPEADRIAAEARRADASLVSDPIAARSAHERNKADAEALAARAADVRARRDDEATGREALAKLREDVAARRRDGLRLDEDGGDPDDPAARADRAFDDLRSALEAGDPASAATSLAAGRAALDQARGALDSIVQARDAVAKGLPEARRESRRLAEAMGQYAAFEAELDRDYAAESWRDVAGNLAQARALLETFDRKADEIEREADPRAQKYLLAARLLGRMNQEQRAVFQLMNGVGERLTALKGARDQARRLGDDLTALDREVDGFFRQYDHVVGASARSGRRAAAEAKAEADRLASSPRPDWPAVLNAMARAREEFGVARSHARTDLDIFNVLTSEYDDARRYASRVESMLAGRSEDRPAANERYRRAVEVLDLVGDDGVRAGNEWPRLLEQVRGARSDLEQSESMAREDVRLARRAEAEIDQAARTIREARGYLSMGVGVDVAAAEALLDRARSHHRAREYERAVQAAGSAVRQVREARQAADLTARDRLGRAEAEQRRRTIAAADFGARNAMGSGGTALGGVDSRGRDAARG